MFVYSDGGRAAAGYSECSNDCCARAFTIVSGLPYREVHDRINDLAKTERRPQWFTMSCASTGVNIDTTRRLAEELGGRWAQTRSRAFYPRELPQGRFVLALNRHLTAMIDCVLYDIGNPMRHGVCCVHGYWRF